MLSMLTLDFYNTHHDAALTIQKFRRVPPVEPVVWTRVRRWPIIGFCIGTWLRYREV